MMPNSVIAIIKNGKIETLEPVVLPEGQRVLITKLSDEGDTFRQQISQSSLDKIWNNAEDDVYARLLDE